MRQLSFSTVILTVLFTALICVSGSLLFFAHKSSTSALSEEIKLSHQQDSQLLKRMVSDYLTDIGTTTKEISNRSDIRTNLETGEAEVIHKALSTHLFRGTGQQVDGMVITSKNSEPIQINGSSLYSLDLSLTANINNRGSIHNWVSYSVIKDEVVYEFAHYKSPIVSPDFGEIIGAVHAFVLLNDNFLLLSESLEITGASAAALKSEKTLLGIIDSDGIAQSELTLFEKQQTIKPLDRGSKHLHQLTIGNQSYLLQLYKAGTSNQVLADAYNKTLWGGMLLVVFIAVLSMLIVRNLVNNSLTRLIHYAEKAPNERTPAPFQEASFMEFNKVGHQIEEMLKEIRAQENQLDSILRHSPSAIFMKSADMKYLMVNRQFEKLFAPHSSVIGVNDKALFPQDQAELIERSDLEVIRNKLSVQSELILSTTRGPRSFLSTKFPLINEKGELYGIAGITTDITERLQAQKEAKITQLVFEAAAEAILIIKPQGDVITNSSFSRITGFDYSQAKLFASLLFEEHPEIDMELSSSGRWQGESIRRKENGETLPLWISISTITEANEEKSYVVVFSDISQLKEAERQLEKFANYDSLTNLPNRSLFFDRIEASLSRAARAGKKTALLHIDIDNFKYINDNIGHQAGDLLLKETAKRISTQIRPGDTVSRLGGDEFVVILSELESADGVQDIARNILLELRTPVHLGGKDVNTSSSIGIAIFPDDGLEAEQLIRQADTAMYHVKQSGRNDIMFFDKRLNAQAEARVRLENDLKKALYSDELFVVYQPRFSADGKTIFSAEALLRWKHPTDGFIPPSEFIPLAESSGLIIEIGRMVLNQACMAAASWTQENDQKVAVSINLSARQLHDANILVDIENALNGSGLDPSLLELEITETMVIEDMELAIARLEAIRQIGVRFSVDDFGTGYSSLMYLKRLPISTVKIDKSFIDDIPGTIDSENLILAVISMSHSLRLSVVAEGVETEEQLAFLAKHGCDEIQGYLLGKPDSEKALEEKLLAIKGSAK